MPRPTGEAAALQYFHSRAAGYAVATERKPWLWLRRREAKAMLALSGSPKDRTVLDLGCGAGFYACLMAQHGATTVVAVDASPDMLERIGNPTIETLAGDVATVRLGNRFDLVLLAGVLEFLGEPTAALITARVHLAPGGTILLLLPPVALAGHLYRAYHRGHGVTVTLFDRQSLQRLAAAAQLRLVTVCRVHPYALACALEPA